MQPPPRKCNYAKFLKNLHSEQIAKLHAKNQHECDLLEDIRQYTIKRSAIEKSYSEALLKVSSAYLNKKIPNIPDIKVDGAEEKWNMWNVWRTVLEENEKLARARLAAVEVFQQQIADEAKLLRQHKVNVAKKSTDILAQVHKELQLTVNDVDKTKKLYFDEEHSAHDVRDKAKDIEEKLKKKKGSFFQSITSLQKTGAKVSSKRDVLEEKSTGARNDYVLSLAAANAHQTRYFLVELQGCMQSMESQVYDRVADFLTLMGRTELLTCSAMQHSFGKIRDQAQQLTREYNLQCCYLYFPVLKQHIQYEFEPCDNDPVDKVTMDHENVTAALSSEARRWASRIIRDTAVIRDSARKLQHYQTLRDTGHKVDPNEKEGPELDIRIEELRNAVRCAETSKVKCEARLECLRIGGAPVDEWLKEVDLLAVQEPLGRSSSLISVRTDASGAAQDQPSSESFYDSDNTEGETPAPSTFAQTQKQQSRDSEHEDEVESATQEDDNMQFAFATNWDDPTQVSWGNDAEQTAATTGAAASETEAAPTILYKCTALYSYSAQNPDELSIIENEQLEVVGEGDGDGWLRARNYKGEEGYVPHNYLDIDRDEQQTPSATGQLPAQISFSSVDYTVEGEEVQSPDQISVISAPVAAKPQEHKEETVTQQEPATNGAQAEWCFVLYDYEAVAEDEINLEEGQMIRIISRNAHDIDDGWWRGEADGAVGNFPSLIVEECDENGEPLSGGDDDITPPESAPPMFATPPPTPPDVENELINDNNNSSSKAPSMPPPPPPPEAEEEDDSAFNMELTETQQNTYDKQFVQRPPVMIVVDEVEADNYDEDEDMPETLPPKETSKQKPAEDSDSELGVAQIVITAATPVFEHPEQPFPPAPSEVNSENVTPTSGEFTPPSEDDSPPTIESPPPNSITSKRQSAGSPPKQVRGGRASIPDELDSDQLARLQDLKESNA